MDGTASFLEINWSRSDVLQLFTHVSFTFKFGVSAMASARYFLTILTALSNFWNAGSCFGALGPEGKAFRKKIIVHCDNLDAVQAWASLASKSKGVLELTRDVVPVAANNNFTFTINQIKGLRNDTADSLSRFPMERIHSLAPYACNTAVGTQDVAHLLRSLQSILEKTARIISL